MHLSRSFSVYTRLLPPLTLFLVVVLFIEGLLFGQDWQVFQHEPRPSLRGIYPINDDTAWACGNMGTILKLSNRGATATICKVQRLEQSDFRAIYAWDSQRCIVATAGKPACIAKTMDGGITWQIVFQSNFAESFINGMKFVDGQRGIAFGDPIQGRLEIFITADGGSSWKTLPPDRCPVVETGEAGFAASNSSIALYDDRVWIGLGGRNGNARLIHNSIPNFQIGDVINWQWESLDIASVKSGPSSGIFSIGLNETTGWVVGGDYQQTDKSEFVAAFSNDRGVTWKKPASWPRGFRSCVIPIPSQKSWLAVGPTGTDIAKENRPWERLNDIGFHSVVATQSGAIWASGSDGRIGRLSLP
ncbi:MAG: WD40/YVTN/BNR-like repeat-containing protein [Pirellula sp.]|jgi:photosystem II stability/assembly factor-like uncharacterized protein